MSITRTETVTLYQYDELSDEAKETARDWWLSCRDESDYECVIEDFQRIGELLGIEFKTHDVRLMSGKSRPDPNIWYSVSYCQGDYAAFEGWISYRKGMAKAVREYAPTDADLHALADEMAAVFAKGFYRDRFTVNHGSYYGTTVESSKYEWSDAAHERAAEIKQIVRRLNDWLYAQLRTQDDWLSSEKQIADAMAANEYTFDENGKHRD